MSTPKRTFDIFDSAGLRLARLELYNYGFAKAEWEAQEVARLLTGGNWILSRPEDKATKEEEV